MVDVDPTSRGEGEGGAHVWRGGIITRLKTEIQNKQHTSVAVLINSKHNKKSNLFQYKPKGRLYISGREVISGSYGRRGVQF